MRSLLVRKKEETIIRAITALQSIELDIFNIFKQLPDVRIEDIKENNDLPDPDLGLESEVWGSAPIDKPRDLDEQSYSDEENRDYFEKKMKKYKRNVSATNGILYLLQYNEIQPHWSRRKKSKKTTEL